MIRMSVLYPATDTVTFDHEYYRDVHVPMCRAGWNVTSQIDRGVQGPYIATVHLFFESLEHFETAMAGEASAAIHADVASYTNVAPVVQVSEVVE